MRQCWRRARGRVCRSCRARGWPVSSPCGASRDIETLRAALPGVSRVVIIGGGYIGLEVAAVLRQMHLSVILLEAEDRVLKRVTSEPVSAFFDGLHRGNGVEILTQVRVAGLTGETRVTGVQLEDGRSIAADAVLLAVGAAVNSELAADAGLNVSDGIMVDVHGRTSAPDVYACGDCARFDSRRYGRSVRLESVQNAIDQAKCVAAAIMGQPVAHDPVPWFWSDQYRTKLQIAGLFSPGDDVTVEGEPGVGPFAVEYRRGGRLVRPWTPSTTPARTCSPADASRRKPPAPDPYTEKPQVRQSKERLVTWRFSIIPSTLRSCLRKRRLLLRQARLPVRARPRRRAQPRPSRARRRN